ncbi:MAG: deoxyribose-phosphate aldolase [Terriglobales bacterium]
MLELAPNDYRELVEAVARQLAPAPSGAGADRALAAALEATLLAADATAAGIDQLCLDAARSGLAAVCVQPSWVARAVAQLRATPVAVATVIGFPLGANLGSSKRDEAAACLALGADELDLVINLGALKSGNEAAVRGEVVAVAALAQAAGSRLKVIVEMGLMDRGEVARVAAIALEAGADFLKTGTGFGPRPASAADVALLRELAAGRARIKAAGGIRTRGQALALLAAGADRIGSSTAAAIVG